MDGFGDFDFNVSGGQGDFQGNQNIVIEESNTNPESNDNNIYQENNINNHNLPTENEIKEKPKSNFGLINDPNSKDENLNNNNIIISQENQETTKSTLDEPITTTLKRDLLVIGNKIKFVIIPKITERKIEELYNWDLWGPLIFCFLYSIALSTGNTNSETSIFVLIFTIFWVGGFVITFNEKFLGSNIGICQTLSLLGYGMFPIIVAGIIIICLIGFLVWCYLKNRRNNIRKRLFINEKYLDDDYESMYLVPFMNEDEKYYREKFLDKKNWINKSGCIVSVGKYKMKNNN